MQSFYSDKTPKSLLTLDGLFLSFLSRSKMIAFFIKFLIMKCQGVAFLSVDPLLLPPLFLPFWFLMHINHMALDTCGLLFAPRVTPSSIYLSLLVNGNANYFMAKTSLSLFGFTQSHTALAIIHRIIHRRVPQDRRQGKHTCLARQ